MPWLDDRIWCHPKLVELTDRAFRVYINSLSYSSGFGLRGRLEKAHQIAIGSTSRIRAELVTRRAWENAGDAIVIHDWDDHNQKRDDALEARREADRERKRAQRDRDRSRDLSPGESRDADRDESRDESEDVHRDLARAPARAGHAPAGAPPVTTDLNPLLSQPQLATRENKPDDEQARRAAWQERATKPDIRSPTAFVNAGIRSGDWPDPYADDAIRTNASGEGFDHVAALIRNGVITQRLELDEELAHQILTDQQQAELRAMVQHP